MNDTDNTKRPRKKETILQVILFGSLNCFEAAVLFIFVFPMVFLGFFSDTGCFYFGFWFCFGWCCF